jgi:predicted TPR repeat methyltransferase
MADQAWALVENNRLVEAKALFARICEIDKNDVEAWSMLGVVSAELGIPDEAVACLQRAIAVDPDYPDAYLHLGKILYAKGELEAALQYCREAVKRDADYVEAWILLSGLTGQMGLFQESEVCSRKALTLTSDSIEAYVNLANALKAQEKHAEAIANYRQALDKDPRLIEVWLLLGDLYSHAGKHEEAERCYQKIVSLNHDHAEARYKLGISLLMQDRPLDAEKNFRHALEIRPDYTLARAQLGFALKSQKKYDEAVQSYQRVLNENPNDAMRLRATYADLGAVYLEKNDLNKAAECYREALRLKPDDQEIRYMLAFVTGGHAPDAAPPDYVRNLFDHYAERFDRHLVNELDYRTPDYLLRIIREKIGSEEKYDILDLGCGTGLCGPIFRGLAKTLTGVDLSRKMLDKARERHLYDELLEGDITAVAQSVQSAYDLIIAADVFVYLGDLSRLFTACKGALRPSGLFAFSVEAAHDGETYVLRSTGRYAHSAEYIRTLAEVTGLEEIRLLQVAVRKERGIPITGYVFLLRHLGSDLAQINREDDV